jgi:hypothetical protein
MRAAMRFASDKSALGGFVMAKRSRSTRTPHERLLPAAISRAVGNLIATASETDVLVGMQIIRMISPVETIYYHAMPIVLGMEFKVKINLLRVLYASYRLPHQEAFGKLCDKIRDAYGRRNEIAHAIITPGKSADRVRVQLFKAQTKTGDVHPPKFLTKEEINEWARQLFRYGLALELLLTSLGYATQGPRSAADLRARAPDTEKGPQEHHIPNAPPPSGRKRPRNAQ